MYIHYVLPDYYGTVVQLEVRGTLIILVGRHWFEPLVCKFHLAPTDTSASARIHRGRKRMHLEY